MPTSEAVADFLNLAAAFCYSQPVLHVSGGWLVWSVLTYRGE
jgi:hypothetical protein